MKINLKTRHIISEILLFTLLWMLVLYHYFRVASLGIQSILTDPELKLMFDKFYGFWDIFFHSLSFGFMFGIINIYFERSKLRKFSLGKIVLLKSFFYILAIAFSDILVLVFNAEFSREVFVTAYMFLMSEMPASFVITTSLYFLFFIVLFNFLYQVNKKIGPGVLFNSIIGKYHHPRDEQLIFMFVDLKNSTRIAEHLEHKKYSLFIKDCFSCLTNPIYNCEADVYQYVGDEAVLIWPLKKGLKNMNCFKLFFEYKRVLDEKKTYFLAKYGIFPEFKAGVDFGEVTVTEVGEIRRDLAYHGDVLNTASRLEKLCKKLSKDFLITEYLNAELPELKGYKSDLVDEFRLEGKRKSIKVYAIEEV